MIKDRDAELIRKCQQGDRQALGQLVSRYEQPIFNAAFRLLGDRDDAHGVTQDVFLKAFEHLDQYNPKYRFFSWIYRIAINESINRLKQYNRQTEFDERTVSELRGPDELADSDRIGECVQVVLMQLQPEYRTVIVLRHFAECSYRQIGEILQIPEKTVKSRLYSARQLMKDKLEESGLLGY